MPSDPLKLTVDEAEAEVSGAAIRERNAERKVVRGRDEPREPALVCCRRRRLNARPAKKRIVVGAPQRCKQRRVKGLVRPLEMSDEVGALIAGQKGWNTAKTPPWGGWDEDSRRSKGACAV